MRTASMQSILIIALASAAAMTAHAQGTKISGLPNASALSGSEKLPAVQGAGHVAITPAQIRSYASNAVDIRDYGVTAGAPDRDGDRGRHQRRSFNLISMVRPQANVINDAASPGGNLPTAAQYTWKMDANVYNVRLSSPDFAGRSRTSTSALPLRHSVSFC